MLEFEISVVAILGRYFPIMDNQGIGLCCSQPPRRQVFSPRGPNCVFEQKKIETKLQTTLKWTRLMNTIYCGSVRVPFKDIQSGNAHHRHSPLIKLEKI